MDDLFLKAEHLDDVQALLHQANTALKWARMSLKPSKCKSLVIVGGKVQHDTSLSIT